MSNNRYLKTDFIYLQIIVFVWGFTGIIGRFSDLTASELSAGRMAVASLFLFLVYLVRFRKNHHASKSFETLSKLNGHSDNTNPLKKAKQPLSKNFFIITIFTGVLVALHWFTFFKAIKISNVSTALSCMSSAALFSSVLESVFLKKTQFSSKSLVFSMLCIFGVSLIYLDDITNSTGMAVAIFSAFLAASFTTINAGLIRKGHSDLDVSLIEMISGTVTCILLFDLSWGSIFSIQDSYNFATILILGILCTALPFLVSIKIMRSLAPSTICISLNLEPIYAIVMAYFLFNEGSNMGLSFLVGASLVMFSAIANGLTITKSDQPA
jgi:drug/metabolite transporter (DMT)-like permease